MPHSTAFDRLVHEDELADGRPPRPPRTEKAIEQGRRQVSRQLAAHGLPDPSDHAVLRYLERIEGLDIAAVKARMMDIDERGRQALEQFAGGTTTITVNNTHKLRFKNGAVVTVLPVQERARA
ncbi:hypothetical protein [Hymenobacter latericus]|uniref:hypothetical protein n=1 Tax=Hymenobacter sp. YIM 151858-1 TaxID=2987688 RepID=UPI002225FF02|nr:hypothetical protein [Hymenobacter sp. YIM 151858-1]UYZ60162.1 hypothetical protein OIS50_05005 [Hymenobacter sp. YIM 151858-1]